MVYLESYHLSQLFSPHAAVPLDGIAIEIEKIIPPKIDHYLIVEGVGGVTCWCYCLRKIPYSI
ncbi:MAG: hypothetical protein ACMUEM_03300 [Flavobacteriales bacterium AspAUS03]